MNQTENVFCQSFFLININLKIRVFKKRQSNLQDEMKIGNKTKHVRH